MAKKKSRQKKTVKKPSLQRHSQPQRSSVLQTDLGVPKADVDHFMKLYDAKRLGEAEDAAWRMTQQFPDSAFSWKALGTTLLEGGNVEQALEHLHRSVELNDSDPLSLTSLAAVYYQQGDSEQAVDYQTRAVKLQPDYAPAQYRLAEMLQSAGKHVEALDHASKAQQLGYDPFKSGVLVGSLLYQTKYFSEALEVYKKLEIVYPGCAPVYNNLGNLYKDIGCYEKAESYYQRALDTRPDYVMAYSNIFFAKHYNPSVSQEEILDFAKGWDQRFSLSPLPAPVNRQDPAKPLRVGLISSGFRIHPVGQMIATAMESSRPDIHFYAYSTNDHDDYVTKKIREATRVWRPMRHLGQKALAQQIRDDAIDILIDLSGHGDGSCLQAISMRPAPICVKWVGGLVNTMGLSSIDYLISDAIETPEGVDDQYTEKLIRLPDDYICYMPCPYAPATTSLPAVKNGYVTLGCLNNPAKIGKTLLSEWAKLMHELPESRLLLRGAQYESEDFCRWIRDTLAEHGIDEYRVILKGPVKHKEFLETYQRIDIALDTWPYSGGLTTCEAMLMGVPVVTLPGPTFAGRHSATHLTNAGLPELVTGSWDEYRQRVLELAGDLPNLAVIRAGLRTILHYSPVCDAPRFANHFNNALRAIWQRYCKDEAPEALTFNKEGEARFAGDKEPVELVEAREEDEPENRGFDWQLDSPVVAVDNGAVLPSRPDARELLGSGNVVMLSFDPAGKMETVDHLAQYGEIQHFPYTALGNGQPATLYLGEGVEPTSLSPVDPVDDVEAHEIPSIALDSVEGLPAIDVFALDARHDSLGILQHASEALKNTLAVQVSVALEPASEQHPDFSNVQSLMRKQGFRFHCFVGEKKKSWFPDDMAIEPRMASEVKFVEALFIPGHERMKSLSEAQRVRFAFILHAIFGANDVAFRILNDMDGSLAAQYLESERLGKGSEESEFVAAVSAIDEEDTIAGELDKLMSEEY